MKNKIFYFLTLVLLTTLTGCDEPVEPTGIEFITFEDNIISDVTVSPGGEFTKTITVYSSNKTGSDRSIELNVKPNTTLEAGAYTVPATVTIPANTNQSTIDIILKDVGLDIIEDQLLGISMSGGADSYFGEEDITLNVAKGCNAGSSKFKIAVSLDGWPEEVYWRVVDTDAGVIVIANNATPGFGGYAGLTETQKDATCLPTGNYVFEIFDAYEDGAGAVSCTLGGVQVFSSNGGYGAGTSVEFSVN
jgi:hypothetical protein